MDSGTGIVVSPNAIVPFMSVCVISEAFSSVEKNGSMSARVYILSTGGITVSLGVERSSFPATGNIGVDFSSKLVSLNSCSLVTDVVPETVEKSVNHKDVKLDRAVVYLSAIASVVKIESVVVLALFSMGVPDGIMILVVVNECPVLDVLPWNTDVNRVWSGLEIQVISLVENRWAPSSFIDVGPDSDALNVEGDLVKIKGNKFSPSVGVIWVYTGPVIIGENILSTTLDASMIPVVKAVCVVSASITVCTF